MKRGLYEQIAAEVAAEVERLAAVAVDSLGPSGAGLAAVELAIRTAMSRLGASLLQQLLATDTGHRGPRIDCGAGHHAAFVGYHDKNLDTVLGRVVVRRAYYHCASCGRGVVPRDDELGVAGASLSPGLRKITARAAATAPFAQAADLLADLAGIRLNPKRIERSAEADGGAAAARLTTESAAIAHRRVAVLPTTARGGPDKLYIALDGTGVPMVGAAVADRAGKAPDGRARTREVKLAALFTQTRIDDAGRPVRDPDSTSYLASFAPAAEFATLVHAEARRRGADHIRQLVVLGDGAPWIWNLATTILPEATPIVDLYHAREHLHGLAAELTGTLGDAHPDWLAARLAELDAGDIETLVTETERLCTHSCPTTSPTTPRKHWDTSKPTPTGCATPTSAPTACSSAPVSSRPAVNPSSVNASNCPACAGTSLAPPASSPCAATRPATASTASGHSRTTRSPATPPHDQQASGSIQDQIRLTYKSVAHPTL